PVRRQSLRDGDRVQVGDTTFRVELAAGGKIDTTVTDTTGAPQVQARVAVGQEDPAAIATDLEAARRGLRLLRDLGGAAAAAHDVGGLGRAVLGRLIEVRNATRVAFLLGDAERVEVLASVAKPGVQDTGAVPRAALELAHQEGAALLCMDAAQDPRLAESLSLQELQVDSFICVPLLHDGTAQGFLYLEARGGGRFREEDLRILATAGDQTAMALANLRMREQLLAQERIERELEHARAIQEAFLSERIPEVEGVAAAARSIPAREVVSGKGMGAALMAARTLAEVRALVAAGHSPGAVFTLVNAAISADMPMGMFVTAAMVWCEPEHGRLTVSNAGHPLPLVRHADGGLEPLDLARGVPLGIDPAHRYPEGTVTAAGGDTLLLVSDGVGDEAGAPDPEVLFADAPADPEAIIAAVLVAGEGAKVRDDRTAVVVRFA
ncbi:MAG: PP2C family protein-serine/threonine phosphatase, partial [Planctomycetota bacterium]